MEGVVVLRRSRVQGVGVCWAWANGAGAGKLDAWGWVCIGVVFGGVSDRDMAGTDTIDYKADCRIQRFVVLSSICLLCDKGRERDRNMERHRNFSNTGESGNNGAKNGTVDNQREEKQGEEWNSLVARPNVEAHWRSCRRNVGWVR